MTKNYNFELGIQPEDEILSKCIRKEVYSSNVTWEYIHFWALTNCSSYTWANQFESPHIDSNGAYEYYFKDEDDAEKFAKEFPRGESYDEICDKLCDKLLKEERK